jgi:ubiquinone/menaquinone biosynthesis C-methylase UbiE
MDRKEALRTGYDRSAAAYDQAAGEIYLQTIQDLLPRVRVGSLPAILDVGCGTGINLLEAARVLGPCRRLAGVDLSPGMASVARRKAALAGVTASFSVGDAEALEIEDGAFDLVLCNSAYHWFADRPRAIKELSRVLRPGGQLVLACLAEPGYEEWIGAVSDVWGRLFGRACPALPEMPSAVELKSQLRACGLGIEHYDYQITSSLVVDVPAFLAMLSVIAPVWLAAAPEGEAPQVMEATLHALTRSSPGGFLCTHARIEAVARKGAPVPLKPRRAPS